MTFVNHIFFLLSDAACLHEYDTATQRMGLETLEASACESYTGSPIGGIKASHTQNEPQQQYLHRF